MGDEDYDDYSKELSQYRRPKDGRGRGRRGQEVARWGAPSGHSWSWVLGRGSGSRHFFPLQD